MPLEVNNQVIDDAIIDQEFSTIKAHYESMASISCCERDDEFRGYARDNIIFRALLTQEAKKTIPEPNKEEVDADVNWLGSALSSPAAPEIAEQDDGPALHEVHDAVETKARDRERTGGQHRDISSEGLRGDVRCG